MKIPFTIVFLAVASTASAASFDCTKAISRIEKRICDDPVLSKLDSVLANNYSSMIEADFGGSKANLKAEQRSWMAKRNTCKDRGCLIEAYRLRIDQTCEYGVISGAHPVCVYADDVNFQEGMRLPDSNEPN